MNNDMEKNMTDENLNIKTEETKKWNYKNSRGCIHKKARTAFRKLFRKKKKKKNLRTARKLKTQSDLKDLGLRTSINRFNPPRNPLNLYPSP